MGETASKETLGLQVLSERPEPQLRDSDLPSGGPPVQGSGLGPTVGQKVGMVGSPWGALD